MRTFIMPAFALAVVAVSTAPAYCGTKLVPEEGAVQVILLRQEAVHEDLKLTPQEIQKIDEFCDKQWAKAKKIADLNESERDKKFEEMTRENEQFIDQTLTKEQRKRLDEITLQVAGLLWVTRDEVASKLDLSDEQKQKARQLQQTARNETEELLHATKAEQKQEELRELRRTSRERLMTLLTADQKEKWREMTGKPLRGELQFKSKKRTLR